MTGSWHLAIDFGTSNSAAAHTSPSGGMIEALALSHRSNLMPSAVYVEPGGNGGVVSGDSALLAGRREPSRLVLSPKRFIDHDTVQLEGDDVPARKIFSVVIADIVERAKAQHAGADPETVTLTHPERWSHNAIGNLVDSAQAAGVDPSKLRTISEPRAAAIHYAAQQHVPAGEHVAVFDFGGGTLDIAVLRAEHNGDYRVVAAKGDNSLGGRTVDNLIYRWVIDQIDHDDPDLADELRRAPASVMNSLQENIREAKEMLSDTSSATITISSPAGEKDVLITRDEFNQIISPPIQRAAEMTRAVLNEAGVAGEETPIYLTGGSSRIPFVQDELGKVGRVMRLDDPKTVVCRGALVATLQGFTHQVQPGHSVHRAQSSGGSTAANPFSSGAPTAGQAPQPAPRTPQQHAHQATSTQAPIPSSAQNTKKKSSAPLFVGLGVVGLLAAGGLGWWALSGNDGDDSEETTSTVAEPSPEGTTAATPADEQTETTQQQSQPSTSAQASSAPGSRYVSVGELLGGDEFLPQAFRDSMNKCDTEEQEAKGLVYLKWLEDPSVKYNTCTQEGNNTGVVALQGDSAQRAFDHIQKLPGEDATEIEGGNPKIFTVTTGTSGSPFKDAVIYYPDKKAMFVTLMRSGGDADEEARTYAKNNGFM